MKIGVTQIVLGDWSLEEVRSLCVEAGYQAIELFFKEGGVPDIGLHEEEIARIGEEFAASGIEVSSVIAWYKERGNFLTPDPAAREAARRTLKRGIEIAGILGAPVVLLHPGAMDPNGSYLDIWETFVVEMRQLGEFASAHGVRIAIENVWNRFMLSPMEAKLLFERVAHPNVGLYLDTANMMLFGYTEQWIRDLGPYIAAVHFKDFRRSDSKFVDLMDGDTNWPAVMAALRDVGYQGAVLHEIAGDRAKQLELAERMRRIAAM